MFWIILLAILVVVGHVTAAGERRDSQVQEERLARDRWSRARYTRNEEETWEEWASAYFALHGQRPDRPGRLSARVLVPQTITPDWRI